MGFHLWNQLWVESSHVQYQQLNLFGILTPLFSNRAMALCQTTECILIRECHGSLIEMKASEYQKLWLSEGGGQATPGYAEIMVPVHPYHANGCFYIQ